MVILVTRTFNLVIGILMDNDYKYFDLKLILCIKYVKGS